MSKWTSINVPGPKSHSHWQNMLFSYTVVPSYGLGTWRVPDVPDVMSPVPTQEGDWGGGGGTGGGGAGATALTVTSCVREDTMGVTACFPIMHR